MSLNYLPGLKNMLIIFLNLNATMLSFKKKFNVHGYESSVNKLFWPSQWSLIKQGSEICSNCEVILPGWLMFLCRYKLINSLQLS